MYKINYKINILIFISGNASNLQMLINQYYNNSLKLNLSCVISNKLNAYGLHRAKNNKIDTLIIKQQNCCNRKAFDQNIIQKIKKYKYNYIILAGFMRIFSATFIKYYYGKLVNIHPSLLPKYKGICTHQRVIKAKEKNTGSSIHFVTNTLDGGPIIAQIYIKINLQHNIESINKKLNTQENIFYLLICKLIKNKRIVLQKKNIYLDKKLISKTGYNFTPQQIIILNFIDNI